MQNITHETERVDYHSMWAQIEKYRTFCTDPINTFVRGSEWYSADRAWPTIANPDGLFVLAKLLGLHDKITWSDIILNCLGIMMSYRKAISRWQVEIGSFVQWVLPSWNHTINSKENFKGYKERLLTWLAKHENKFKFVLPLSQIGHFHTGRVKYLCIIIPVIVREHYVIKFTMLSNTNF